ncbi:hypothetical protein C8R45DRAFT_1112375 [Mycena sanguinolenta]|nr:hypothetical protein C8R45DRAFT_1112375 [Mycena sanguinolenta]
MKANEMVPDTFNPAHDPRFWCLPPVRDAPTGTSRQRHRMYLVTQGRSVGVWHNWTVVKAMTSGFPSAAQHGHETMEACVAEWQQHCALGVHQHPAAPPAIPAPAAVQLPDLAVLTLSDNEEEGIDEHNNDETRASIDDGTSVSTDSRITSNWDEVPLCVRYFALWRERIMYTDRGYARMAFLRAERVGASPRILSTANFDEAEAFGEGVYWL